MEPQWLASVAPSLSRCMIWSYCQWYNTDVLSHIYFKETLRQAIQVLILNPVKYVHDIINHQCIASYCQMALHGIQRGCGRPKKFTHGWSQANKWIHISNETHVKWRMVKEEFRLVNNDTVAQLLLSRSLILSHSISPMAENTAALSRLVSSTLLTYI